MRTTNAARMIIEMLKNLTEIIFYYKHCISGYNIAFMLISFPWLDIA